MVLPDSTKEKLLDEVRISASRSGGPGGQNVNKVSTKIELRFEVAASEVLNDAEKQLILSKLKNRINTQGELLVTSNSERTQFRNRELAARKFIELIEKALTKPKRRKKTQPTAASRLRRIESKKMHSRKKQLRKPPGS